MEIYPIAENKHKIITDAVASVHCQEHLVFRSSDSNSQSCKSFLNASKSHADPWLTSGSAIWEPHTLHLDSSLPKVPMLVRGRVSVCQYLSQ